MGKSFWEISESILKTLLKPLDYILPKRCMCCDRILGEDEQQMCIWCKEDIPYTYFWNQARNPMSETINLLVSDSECLNETEYIYGVSLFFYRPESPYSNITRQLKYDSNIGAGRYFAGILADKIRMSKFLEDVDLLVPVPLHWLRLYRRGFNQAQVIARQISKILHIPLDDAIITRSRYTRTQTKLDVNQKALNVRNAFKIKKTRDPAPRHILIIDDVFTTGSTLMEVFKTLRTVFPPEVTRISIATLGYVDRNIGPSLD